MNDSQVIDIFEKAVAEYAGSKYGVAISSQTNAVFLCLELLKMEGKLKEGDTISIPKRTYMSIPMMILNSNLNLEFKDIKWSGAYPLEPTNIYDSAVRFTKDMYVKDSLYCVSFQYRKGIPIGRGGMVLLDDKTRYELLKKLRFNGRTDGVSQADDVYTIKGWNMYLCPENCARGLTLLSILPEKNKDIASYQDYPDISDKFELIK